MARRSAGNPKLALEDFTQAVTLEPNADNYYQRAYKIWDQGRVPGSFWIDTNGWKYKMSNVQAAIGLGQLERIEELVEALSGDPIAFLVGLQLARGRADPVETEVDDLHPVRPDVTVCFRSPSRASRYSSASKASRRAFRPSRETSSWPTARPSRPP